MFGAHAGRRDDLAAFARSASSAGDRAVEQDLKIEAANAYAQLAFHGLAHLPLSGAHALYDARYVAWCRETLTADAREPLASDAGRIAMQVESLGAGLALQWLPGLHTTLTAFTRSAPQELRELDTTHDVRVDALRALQSADPRATEWLRVDLLLAASAYTTSAPTISDDVSAQVAAMLAGVAPSERPENVALVHALGARGRVLGNAIFVGAPATWSGVTPAMSAAIAMHEHAVSQAPGDFVRREWAALQRVARTLQAGQGLLHEAHATWLAMADLAPLAEAATELGLVRADVAHALLIATDRSLAFAELTRA